MPIPRHSLSALERSVWLDGQMFLDDIVFRTNNHSRKSPHQAI